MGPVIFCVLKDVPEQQTEECEEVFPKMFGRIIAPRQIRQSKMLRNAKSFGDNSKYFILEMCESVEHSFWRHRESGRSVDSLTGGVLSGRFRTDIKPKMFYAIVSEH